MSHVPGLESWREAPPLLGPLLSPFSPRSLWVLPDAALQSPVTHHQLRWVRGPGKMQPRQGDERQRDFGDPSLERLQPGCRVGHLAGELEPGQRAGRRGEEGVGEGGGEGGCKPRSWGVRGRGRPFSRNFRGSRCSVRGAGTEWTAGLAAGPGPSPPPLSARGRLRCRPCAHRPRVAGRPRAPRPLCYGRTIPAPSCRRVSAAPGYRRSYPTPSRCRVRAGPGAPGRGSPPTAGGRGISPPTSGLRDAPSPGDRGLSQTRGERLISLAHGGRSVSEAEGSRRLLVAPRDCRYPAAANNRRVPTGPGRRGGSGLRAFPGSPARSQAR